MTDDIRLETSSRIPEASEAQADGWLFCFKQRAF
jgi:hypothetical protein